MQTQDSLTHTINSAEMPMRTQEMFARKMPFLPLPVVVRSAFDLEILQKMKNRRRLQVFLRISGLPIGTSKQWEAKLNSCLKECGCSLGAKCVITALGASLIWQTVYSLWSVSHWPVFFLRTLTVVFVAGAVGKSAAKLRARSAIRAIEGKIRDFEHRYATGG
jgi:hypothetical protein